MSGEGIDLERYGKSRLTLFAAFSITGRSDVLPMIILTFGSIFLPDFKFKVVLLRKVK